MFFRLILGVVCSKFAFFAAIVPNRGCLFHSAHLTITVAWDGLCSQPSGGAGGSGRAGPGRHPGGTGSSEGGCRTGSSEDEHGQEKTENLGK